MFFDDINGLVSHFGTLKTQIGYISNDMPSYQTNSVYSSLNDQKLFFEDISLNIENYAEYKQILVDQKL